MTEKYDVIGKKSALGSSQTVLNVGAGTGSYEPANRFVIAVEPSCAEAEDPQVANES